MDLIKKYSLELVKTIKLQVEPEFSMDNFIEKHRAKFSYITPEMIDSDTYFPLKNDFSGEIEFNIFKINREIYPTYKFLLDIKKENHIFVGVKGIALLFLNNRKELPKNSWILSPNKTLPAKNDGWSTAIPNIYTMDQTAQLKYSTQSVSRIREGMHIVFGKK